jgi:hypothetical protein
MDDLDVYDANVHAGGRLHTRLGKGKKCLDADVCAHRIAFAHIHGRRMIERLSMGVCAHKIVSAHTHGKGEGKRYGVVMNKGVHHVTYS